MSILGRRSAQAIALTVLGALGWLGGCSDNPSEPIVVDSLTQDVIVSDPVAAAELPAAAGVAVAMTSAAADTVVFVSLPPGTIPAGRRAIVRRVGNAATLTTTMLDGGFDPVPVGAQVGDSIAVAVTDAAGGIIQSFGLSVGARRPPIVVRTDPPRRKTDVPLNAAIVVVFSEPVAGGTLTPSTVRLLRGGNPVAGAVTVLQGSAATAVFTPSAPLSANTDYELVVTRGVRDLGGDALAAGATVEFTTGTTTVLLASQVTVFPDMVAVMIGSQVQLIVAARDSNGRAVVGRPITWTTDNPAVATVSATGLVTAVAEGVAHIRAVVDGTPGEAVILVSATLTPVDSVEVRPESATVVIDGFVQLTAVLRDAAGNVLQFRPVNWETSAPAVAGVGGGSGGKGLVTGVSAGTATITATSEGKSATARITVGTVGPFTLISAGGCALTTDGPAWCWGSNGAGELGNGTLISSSVPTAVAGGLRFSRISAPCALTEDGAAYCWGLNWDGALGIGTAEGPEQCPNAGQCSTTPVAVAGGQRFAAIDRGVYIQFTCAVTQSGDAYCWGNNELGELGLGTKNGPEYCQLGGPPRSCSTVPAAVAGGLKFTAVTAGRGYACALTASGAAYCWGVNDSGQLGDGTTSDRLSPVPVVGGRTFVAIAAGYDQTCAVTSDGSAYCWGGGSKWVPTPVAGTPTFATISAGVHHRCALTTLGTAYCWGSNWLGQLGDGTTTDRTSPVPVAGGHVFTTLDAGDGTSCGVTTAGVAYCWGGGSTVPAKVPGQP